jgi:tRNA A-37 threonylcarbamoyl transferase component Bud32
VTLDELLGEHGLTSTPRVPIQHAGFSGAGLYRLQHGDGQSFVLKSRSIHDDWIMRSTEDIACREAVMANRLSALPDGVRNPAIATAVDEDTHSILMDDIAPHLLGDGTINEATLDTILARMADLHAATPPDDVPWCDLRRRLTLLTPERIGVAAAYGAPVAADVRDGWAAFEHHAPDAARRLIRALFADPSLLVRALGRLQQRFLHGDLKLDNMGVEGETLWLVDWSMALVAPAAVDLGWFLAINSRRLPVRLDEVMERYAEAASMPSGVRPLHDALTVMCGLLLRGWRKGLDTEAGEPDELNWWCERVAAAAPILAE